MTWEEARGNQGWELGDPGRPPIGAGTSTLGVSWDVIWIVWGRLGSRWGFPWTSLGDLRTPLKLPGRSRWSWGVLGIVVGRPWDPSERLGSP